MKIEILCESVIPEGVVKGKNGYFKSWDTTPLNSVSTAESKSSMVFLMIFLSTLLNRLLGIFSSSLDLENLSSSFFHSLFYILILAIDCVCVCRQLEEELVVGGYTIPKDSIVVMCHHIMSNSEEFIANPKTFCPERWIKSSEQYVRYFSYS